MAVGAGEEGGGDDEGVFASELFLEEAAGLHVVGLVGATDLEVGVEVVHVVALHDGIEGFVEADSSTGLETVADEFAGDEVAG